MSSEPMFLFRSLCSGLEPRMREMFEAWATKHVLEFRVEARIDRKAPNGYLEYTQEATLHKLVEGVVSRSGTIEHEEWMQGDLRMGRIITRRIRILAEP